MNARPVQGRAAVGRMRRMAARLTAASHERTRLAAEPAANPPFFGSLLRLQTHPAEQARPARVTV